MIEEDLEKVRKKIRKIAGNSGYAYLDCLNGRWKDGNDNVHELSSMNKTYLKNALKTVKNAIKDGVSTKYEYITEVIELTSYNLTDEDKGAITLLANDCLDKLHEEKKEEIEKELQFR